MDNSDIEKQERIDAMLCEIYFLKNAIFEFCNKSKWAADAWKEQEHIKRLFDISREENNG